ncbi:hypothetical protein MKQ68_05015 [Chitinophaga horti]|uniref:TonB C-terminal domain-containing protein n=1 Tax=Chitinophaga horti TaxID=2920382 RepID=A0ABY6J8H3_9BACT|nr:hypothetical protein [Chitinophaga horti]UYQ94449.1 hypothetical protein MKQ68_05015 [Chitinophaga horti]
MIRTYLFLLCFLLPVAAMAQASRFTTVPPGQRPLSNVIFDALTKDQGQDTATYLFSVRFSLDSAGKVEAITLSENAPISGKKLTDKALYAKLNWQRILVRDKVGSEVVIVPISIFNPEAPGHTVEMELSHNIFNYEKPAAVRCTVLTMITIGRYPPAHKVSAVSK